MQITLHLKNHCIETAAKKRYEYLMADYFRNYKNSPQSEKSNIEAEIDNLLFFLENGDFSYLRSNYPELSGIEHKIVIIEVVKDLNLIRILKENIQF